MKGLQESVPEIDLKKYDDGSIWVGAEDACIFKQIPSFNHNLEYAEMLVTEATHTIIPNPLEFSQGQHHIQLIVPLLAFLRTKILP